VGGLVLVTAPPSGVSWVDLPGTTPLLITYVRN
jgi:hypothetical protein